MKFELDDIEHGRALSFMASKEAAYTGAIGGRFSYEFFPTTIGMCVTIKDAVTRTEENITNFDAW